MTDTFFSDTMEKRIPRAQIAAQLRKHGRSESEASETTDLAMQAVRKAFAELENTAALASALDIRIDVLLIGLDLMKAERETFEASLMFAAKKNGVSFEEVTVTGRRPRHA